MGGIVRRLIRFDVGGDEVIGTLDEGDRETGFLIVSGGNEIRAGAHRGMAMLAARLSAVGFPVLRFDRRGVGDSAGVNRGYAGARDDIVAAARAFRSLVPIHRMVALGNCDAATALALHHREAGIDGMILTNPWVVERIDSLPPTAAIRRHYRARLLDPDFWKRALTGQLDLFNAVRGLARIAAKPSQPENGLAAAFAAALTESAVPTSIVLAEKDMTAIAFADAWKALPSIARPPTEITSIASDSHSFARSGDMEALEAILLAAL